MVPLQAEPGFIPDASRRRAKTRPTRVNHAVSMVMDGAMRGLQIDTSFTTALPRVLTANRGVSARSWSGGMATKRNGPGLIHQTLPRIKPLITNLHRAMKVCNQGLYPW